MKRALLVVLAAIVLAACGGPTSGTVIARSFAPAHDDHYPMFMTMCQMVGSTTVCHQQYIGEGTNHVDDAWSLQLRGQDGSTGWVDVTHATYDAHPVGSYFKEAS